MEETSPTLDKVIQRGTVTISRTLNVRQQSPSTSAKVVSQAIEGSQLAYEGWVTNGQPINGNRKWYFDANGDYFWGGVMM